MNINPIKIRDERYLEIQNIIGKIFLISAAIFFPIGAFTIKSGLEFSVIIMIGASMMAMLGCSIITDTELKYHILKNNKMLLN